MNILNPKAFAFMCRFFQAIKCRGVRFRRALQLTEFTDSQQIIDHRNEIPADSQFTYISYDICWVSGNPLLFWAPFTQWLCGHVQTVSLWLIRLSRTHRSCPAPFPVSILFFSCFKPQTRSFFTITLTLKPTSALVSSTCCFLVSPPFYLPIPTLAVFCLSCCPSLRWLTQNALCPASRYKLAPTSTPLFQPR